MPSTLVAYVKQTTPPKYKRSYEGYPYLCIWFGMSDSFATGGCSVEAGEGPNYYTTYNQLKKAISNGLRQLETDYDDNDTNDEDINNDDTNDEDSNYEDFPTKFTRAFKMIVDIKNDIENILLICKNNHDNMESIIETIKSSTIDLKPFVEGIENMLKKMHLIYTNRCTLDDHIINHQILTKYNSTLVDIKIGTQTTIYLLSTPTLKLK